MDSTTILLRQVHPSFVQADNISSQAFSITSQAFRPTSKDNGLLSVYNGKKFTAEQSYNHFVKESTNSSFGVVGVSGAECDAHSLTWTEDNDPFDGHCHVDFAGLSGGEIERKAKRLKAYALQRGWLYRK